MQSISKNIKPPKATIIIVIDQFAYSYIEKLRPFLRAGLKDLLDNGVSYTNAYHPHAMPNSATGHATLNTGTYAKNHGIIGNRWIAPDGLTHHCHIDDAQTAAVFAPNGLYDHGKSACNLMVEGISDTVIQANTPKSKTDVYAIALKDFAAIFLAGKKAKACWFDIDGRCFTTSKAYFDTVPNWINSYNYQAKLNQIKEINWALKYSYTDPAYHFPNIDNYSFAASSSIINKKIPIEQPSHRQKDPLQKNPFGNQMTFDIAQSCIQSHITQKNNNALMLWISLSSLDTIGHIFGSESREAIDLIYHTDHQLQAFMNFVTDTFGVENVLFALTGDHGAAPTPELLSQEGIPAQRLFPNTWIEPLNKIIEKKFNLSNLIYPDFYRAFLYINHSLLHAINKATQHKIITTIKQYLLQKQGIEMVWHHDELYTIYCTHENSAYHFQNQLYPGRSGDIIIKTNPNYPLMSHPTGASHHSPCISNMHVPLIMYQKNRFEKKEIKSIVEVTQLAPTLAHILDVPQPSASTDNLLPGLFTTT